MEPVSSGIDPLQYGMLLQKVNTMERELAEMRTDMAKLLELANQSKGGFWAGMVFVSLVSSIVGYLASVFHKV